MILVVEPVFPNAHHAPGNAGILRALLIAANGEPITFAAHVLHREAVADLLGPDLDSRIGRTDIAVTPPGGIQFRRFSTQARAIIRLVQEQRPRVLVAVGTTPETLFACRLLVTLWPALPILAVLHGNLSTAATGWRSRDPRHRLFDSRSSIRVARHRSIRLVVLDESIRQEAVRLGLLDEASSLAWPQPIDPAEIWEGDRVLGDGPIHIGFVGSAHRAKGFGDFLELVRRFMNQPKHYRFSLAGGMMETYSNEERSLVSAEPGLLSRDEYLSRVRALDYVCLPVDPSVYALTASGSLLDAVAALKPIIAYPAAMVKELSARGPIGITCDDFSSMAAAIGDHAMLANPEAYRRFQDNLRLQRALRSPESLARIIAEALPP